MALLPPPGAAMNPQPDQRSLSRRKKILYTLIVALLVLAVIEGGLKILYGLRDRDPTGQQKAAQVAPYASFDWAKELFVEEYRTQPRFEPYIMWRREEFRGKHLNITSEGLRKTWSPPLTAEVKAKKVFCFGGSTIWGVGARDDFTIPSLLAKKLNQGKSRYVVVNYGEKGYTLTQEVITLVLLLKQGNIPDYVIFYDGVNEVMVGYKNGRAGSIFGADTIRRQLFQKEKKTAWRKLGEEWRRTGIHRAATELRDKLRPYFRKPKPVTPEEETSLKPLADDILADYLRNVEVVRRLAQAYGFKYLFLWQPSLLTNRALTADEKKLAAWDNNKMVKMYELVYERMAKVQQANFYNISTMFDQKKHTLYFSWAHITEAGNDLVAERIMHIWRQEFPEDFPG